jgi:hypothetical protein
MPRCTRLIRRAGAAGNAPFMTLSKRALFPLDVGRIRESEEQEGERRRGSSVPLRRAWPSVAHAAVSTWSPESAVGVCRSPSASSQR